MTALAFGIAGHGRREDAFWKSWTLANLVLGAALVIYIVETHLPRLLIATLPNGMLILGFGLSWRAARQFGGREVPLSRLWIPLVVFVAFAAPLSQVSYAPAFTVANVILTILATAIAWEFWRDRSDGLASRYALVAAYLLITSSFFWRIWLGLASSATMPPHLPLDTPLIIHLVVALIYTVASGTFSLSLAFERSNTKLRHAASHDALTGLMNRGAFETELRAALDDEPATPFTLALFDVDHFKSVNDRFGHAAGDEALRRCAEICRSCTDKGDLVARVGGEEFAIVLKGKSVDAATATIEHVRRLVAATPMHSSGQRFSITISGGLCHNATGRGNFDELMRDADAFLYDAKNKGRNRIETIAA
ncbi:GGDEF domain-containing protein [Mesorhizobium sp. CAU 1741]|uniref:GGDEF domain-containing protein n=1 Tax=Mesorhizobium sp. CAU 1741 TaxID=3140366 RepID=UPI00325A574E